MDWFLDSLVPQLNSDDEVQLLIISEKCEIYGSNDSRINIEHHEPKPNPWSGKHRLTSEDYWSKSSALNSFLCLAKWDFVCAVDDRCVAGPNFMTAIREAYAANRLILGSYAKYHNMRVEHGVIMEVGKLDGKDQRGYPETGIHKAPAQHFYGCVWASPLEWLLEVNGFLEKLDGTSAEDVMMGMVLTNANYLLKFDARLFITEDRTPEHSFPVMKRTSKQRHNYDTKDRAWTALATFGKQKYADNGYSLRALRSQIQSGGQWPTVDPGTRDWWSGKTISEFEAMP